MLFSIWQWKGWCYITRSKAVDHTTIFFLIIWEAAKLFSAIATEFASWNRLCKGSMFNIFILIQLIIKLQNCLNLSGFCCSLIFTSWWCWVFYPRLVRMFKFMTPYTRTQQQSLSVKYVHPRRKDMVYHVISLEGALGSIAQYGH